MHFPPITHATGICDGLNGSFNGQCEVRMGASFFMHTTVDFTVRHQLGADMDETPTGLAIANSTVGQTYIDDHWGKSLAHDDKGASHAALSHLDWLADRYAAVDNLFASGSGPLGNTYIPT